MLMSETPKNLLDVLARLQEIESRLENGKSGFQILAHGNFEVVNDGQLKSGSGDRRMVEHISFDTPLDHVPTVYTSIAGINTDSDFNSRAQVFPENVTTEGFDLVFRTWGPSNLLFVSANWIAIL